MTKYVVMSSSLSLTRFRMLIIVDGVRDDG